EVITFNKSFPENNGDIDKQWEELNAKKKHIDFMDFIVYDGNFSGFKDVTKLIESLGNKKKSPYDIAQKLCGYIYKNFKYAKGITTVNSTLDDVWKLK